MRVLFDTNVVLDLLRDREPWSKTVTQLFTRVESGSLEGYLGATTVTTIFYLAAKTVGAKRGARQQVRSLLALCAIAPVHRPVLEAAIELNFADFEDAVLHEVARQVAAEAIVMRDPAGFKKSELAILTPE